MSVLEYRGSPASWTRPRTRAEEETVLSKIAGWAIGVGAVLVSAGVVFVCVVFNLIRTRAADEVAWSQRDMVLPPGDQDHEEPPK